MRSRQIRRWLVVATLLGTLAIASVAVAATTSSTEARDSVGRSDPVIAQQPYVEIHGPWLVWDKKACRFKSTSSHPATYTARLRKLAKPSSYVYTAFDTQLPVSKLINGSFTRYAKLANIKLTTLSNEFPSVSRPVPAANQAVVLKPAAVLSANILPALYPKIQGIYEAACIPMLNLFRIAQVPHPTPALQTGFKPAGVVLANGAISLIKQRGWPSNQIWVVLCGAPQVANGPNTDFDVITAFSSRIASTLKVPSGQISDVLDCKGTTDDARTVTTDWLTAHPQAKYVVAMNWSDNLAVGMAQALQSKGYTPDTAIAAGGEANDAALALMAQGGQIFQVDFDKNFPKWGLLGLSMAEDVVAGRPVPVYTDPGVVGVVGADGAKKLIAERAAALKNK